MRDLYNKIALAISLAVLARTASANGTGVDLQGHEGAVVEIITGTITDGTHTFEVQESDDNAAFTAVADADLLGAEPVITGVDDNVVRKIGYRGTKRYLRVIVTVTGAPATGGVYGANVIKGFPRHAPTS